MREARRPAKLPIVDRKMEMMVDSHVHESRGSALSILLPLGYDILCSGEAPFDRLLMTHSRGICRTIMSLSPSLPYLGRA